ncbi:sensor histidine kinase [Nocardia pneumoniae]|uniref:sensor histidine kinase n=1 Tax=Nocardia pneumoniae TaxID=228601 RepID=UPI0014612DB1|nr:HAMP domain-containing sensor histidine kinase [Nocardia pneumoniae]
MTDQLCVDEQARDTVGPRPYSVARSMVSKTFSISVMILSLAVIALVAIMGAWFIATFDHKLDVGLDERARLAQRLVDRGIGPDELVAHLETGAVEVRLILTDGTTVGSLDQRRIDHEPMKTLRTGLRSEAWPFRNADLTLGVHTGWLSGIRSQLTVFSLVSGTGTITVTAVLLRFAVRFTPTSRGYKSAAVGVRAAEHRAQRFIADAVHELRTPITGIRAIADAVLAQPPHTDPDEVLRLHRLMVGETVRAGKLLEDMLDLARIDADRPELHCRPCDIAVLATAQTDRARLLNPGIEVTIDGATTVPAHVDPDRVSQILANLLDNACRVTPAGGRVHVTVGDVVDGFEVVVSDTGPGVPVDARSRIFERMVRLAPSTHPDGINAGLGLTIARGWARAHGGDVTCEEPVHGTGATFRVSIPSRPADGPGHR